LEPSHLSGPLVTMSKVAGLRECTNAGRFTYIDCKLRFLSVIGAQPKDYISKAKLEVVHTFPCRHCASNRTRPFLQKAKRRWPSSQTTSFWKGSGSDAKKKQTPAIGRTGKEASRLWRKMNCIVCAQEVGFMLKGWLLAGGS
jgi:hypothetical protein